MKKRIVLATIVLALLFAAYHYEWQYSSEMQEHIDTVNNDLQSAQIQATYSSGLIDSLHAMTAAAEVAGEIFETHNYVHTIKDEVLASKIKHAVEQSDTVGQAIPAVIGCWREYFNK